MKNVSYAEKGRAEEDLSELLGQNAHSDVKPRKIVAKADKMVNSEQTVDEKDAEDLDKPSKPNLKNPVQKYQIVDSSDEELEQDAKDSINLAGRRLQSIPSSVAGQARGVKILTLTNNHITSWDKLSAFTNLETLILDKNNLKTLEGLPSIETLKTLWLNNNSIDDFELILQQIKSLFPNLEYLSVLRNPINPAIYFGAENEKPYYRFRRRILQALPELKVIDTQDVTSKEREDARRQPKYLVASPINFDEEDDDQFEEQAKPRKPSYYDEKSPPAAFIGQGKIKYDGRDSEGNRFITNTDL